MSISTHTYRIINIHRWPVTVANSYALYQFSHLGLGTIFSPSLVHWMDTIYALAFVQNIMTTGLLAYRIWQQHRKSQGVVASAISLIPLVRIIIESASIYLLNLLILIILYALDSNGQFIAQEAIVPVCGKFYYAVPRLQNFHIMSGFLRYCIHANHSSVGYAFLTSADDYSTFCTRNKLYPHSSSKYCFHRLQYHNVRSVQLFKSAGALWCGRWRATRQWLTIDRQDSLSRYHDWLDSRRSEHGEEHFSPHHCIMCVILAEVTVAISFSVTNYCLIRY